MYAGGGVAEGGNRKFGNLVGGMIETIKIVLMFQRTTIIR